MDLPALLLLWVHLSPMGQRFLVVHLFHSVLRDLLLRLDLMFHLGQQFLAAHLCLMAPRGR